MFYASVNKPNPDGGGEVDVFAFYLADKLGKTVGELDAMPHAEYVAWRSYYLVRNQQEELAMKRARR